MNVLDSEKSGQDQENVPAREQNGCLEQGPKNSPMPIDNPDTFEETVRAPLRRRLSRACKDKSGINYNEESDEDSEDLSKSIHQEATNSISRGTDGIYHSLAEYQQNMPPLLAGEYDAFIPVTDKGLMINIRKVMGANGSVEFIGYRRYPDGTKGPAEINNLIRGFGDRIVAVNGAGTVKKNFHDVVGLLRESSKNKFAFIRLLEAKCSTNGDIHLTSFGWLGPKSSDIRTVDRGNSTRTASAEKVAKDADDSSFPAIGSSNTITSCVRTAEHEVTEEITRSSTAKENTVDHVSRNKMTLSETAGQNQNSTPDPIEVGVNSQKSESPSEPIPKQGNDTTCLSETNDMDTVEYDNKVGPNTAITDDGASSGSYFEGPETLQENRVTEATQSCNNVDKSTMIEPSSEDAHQCNDKEETIGTKRLVSSFDIPASKRRRFDDDDNNTVSEDERSKPASLGDPEDVSPAPARAISPHWQRGASDNREQVLIRKREKLSSLLKQRRENLFGEEDQRIVKLREHIDHIDDELLNLIVAE